MKIKTIFTRLSLVLILLVQIIIPQNVTAIKSTITVSPPRQRIILTPGEKYRGSIRVSNPVDAEQDLKYSASIGSFSQKQGNDSKDDYGSVDITSETNYNMMTKWITIENPTGTVAPNDSEDIVYIINVPKDAPAGGQYATILVQDATSADGQNAGTRIDSVSQVASIIYAEVSGETRKVGSITENNLPSFLTNNTLEATSMVRNDGNVHTDATYILQVWPLFSDEEICTNEEDQATNLVMPETERYHTETCNLPAVGIFRAKQTVKIFGEESIVEKTVIVCPLWLIFVIIFAIVALIIWIVMRVRARKKEK